MRVLTTPDTPIPEVQLLSNGRYHVTVTNAGGGGSRWKDLAVTRWREDTTTDAWGTFCYIRDAVSGVFWSAAFAPTRKPPEHYEAIFTEARAEFRRVDNDFETHTEIVVSPEDDIELRRVRITNRARTRRTIDVTSYAEVALASPAADALHPAFSNLFVQTEIVAARQAILCTRRPRSRDETPPWMVHLMAVHGSESGDVSFETDRMAFLGRGRTPAAPSAMTEPGPLAGHQGSVLDPIVAIRHRLTLEPQTTATIDIVTGMADTREAALQLAEKYQDRHLADRVYDLAWTHSSVMLRQINASESDAQLYARLASSVVFANASLRAEAGRDRPQSPWPVRTVELRDLGRPADRPAADRRRGEHRPRTPDGAGARVLAPQGPRRGPRDLERGPRRLPAAAAGPDHGSHRGRRGGARDGSPGRHLRAPGGADRGGGSHPAAIGGARHRHGSPRQPVRTGRAARAARGARAAARADAQPPVRRGILRAASARPRLRQWHGRLHARWRRIRDRVPVRGRSRPRPGRTCSPIPSSEPWCRRAASGTRGPRTRTSSD